MAAALFELLPQCAEVIDLPVEHDGETAVLVVDWLMACREVDDAEASHGDATGLVIELPAVVGPPMRECSIHLRD